MKETALIELLKGSMDIASSSVSAIVGALVTTLFLRKNTQTTEFEKIKAAKFQDVINDLLDSGKMTYLEYYQCSNFLTIAQIADERLRESNYSEEEQEYNNYDFDWFVSFYDHASKISNDQMQKLWASVLEGEIRRPGTTSLSLLHTLSIMQPDQALMFCNISRFVLKDFATDEPHLLIFISSSREAYKSSRITPAELKELERLGLVECDFSSEYIYWRKKMFKTGNKIITVYGDPNNQNKIKAGNVNFTRDGKLLYSIIDPAFKHYRSEILDYTITKFKRRNCRVDINGRDVTKLV